MANVETQQGGETVLVSLDLRDTVIITPHLFDDPPEQIVVRPVDGGGATVSFTREGLERETAILRLDGDELYRLSQGHAGEEVRIEELGHAVSDTEQVLGEVHNERTRQDEKHGGPEHDDAQTMDYLAGLVEARAGQTRHESETTEVRRLLIEAAACAVAAVESLDRRTEGKSHD